MHDTSTIQAVLGTIWIVVSLVCYCASWEARKDTRSESLLSLIVPVVGGVALILGLALIKVGFQKS